MCFFRKPIRNETIPLIPWYVSWSIFHQGIFGLIFGHIHRLQVTFIVPPFFPYWLFHELFSTYWNRELFLHKFHQYCLFFVMNTLQSFVFDGVKSGVLATIPRKLTSFRPSFPIDWLRLLNDTTTFLGGRFHTSFNKVGQRTLLVFEGPWGGDKGLAIHGGRRNQRWRLQSR